MADCCVGEMPMFAQHFQKQLSEQKKYNECIEALHNEWYEFIVFVEGKN
jgi:hypothetical protein